MHSYHCRTDGVMQQQRRLDFAQFDAQTTHLDLEIGTTDELEHSIRQPTDQVAGAIHASPGVTERICCESLGREAEPLSVSPADSDAGDVQFAWHTDRRQIEARVEHVEINVGHRAPDRHNLAVGCGHLMPTDYRRRLRRSVCVDHPHPAVEQTLYRRPSQLFTPENCDT
ncbi:hypothetical protein BKP42_24040 [Rhodococcus erythropolis]|nr:hypothetical protein BKP42_24040 [Rhodococcus erythropolis]